MADPNLLQERVLYRDIKGEESKVCSKTENKTKKKVKEMKKEEDVLTKVRAIRETLEMTP